MELVIEQSGVPYSYEQLRQMVSATAVNTTGLFQVSVTSPNPEEHAVYDLAIKLNEEKKRVYAQMKDYERRHGS